jgi:hypothetical protein
VISGADLFAIGSNLLQCGDQAIRAAGNKTDM